MKLAGKISMLDRIVSDLKASAPTDPFANLDNRQRAALRDYQCSNSPEQQWLDMIDGKNSTAALLASAGLNANCTETEAREAYERELASLGKWCKRRNILKGLRSDA